MNSSLYFIAVVLTIAIVASSSSTSVQITASSESNNNKCYSDILQQFPGSALSPNAKAVIFSVCNNQVTSLPNVQEICTNPEMHAFSIALAQNTNLKKLSVSSNCNTFTLDFEGIQYLAASLHKNIHLESFAFDASTSGSPVAFRPLVENFGCFNVKKLALVSNGDNIEPDVMERVSEQLGGPTFPLQDFSLQFFPNSGIDYISRGIGANACLRNLTINSNSAGSIPNATIQLLFHEMMKTHTIQNLFILTLSPSMSNYFEQLLNENYPCYLEVQGDYSFTVNKPRCNVDPKCLQPSTQTCSNLIPLTLPPSNNNNGLNSPTTSKGLLIGLIVVGVIAVVLAALLILKIRKEKQQEEAGAGGGKYQEINNQ